MKPARDLYYLLYYAIYSFDPFGNSRAYNEWKAFVGVVFLQVMAVIVGDWWLLIWFGKPVVLGLPRPVLGAACIVIAFLNGRELLRRRGWKRYAAEFGKLDPRARSIRLAGAWGVVLAVLCLVIYTLYVLASRPPLARGA